MNIALAAHIVVPLLATIVMSGMEWRADPTQDWRDRVIKVSWDLCILATGLAGGVLSHTGATDPLHLDMDRVIGPISMLLSIGIGLIISSLRPGTPTGRKALVAILLGGAALALPSYHIVSVSH